jgi:hypothetical protein
MHGGKIEKAMETLDSGASEDHLGNVFVFHDAGDSVGNVAPPNPYNLGVAPSESRGSRCT